MATRSVGARIFVCVKKSSSLVFAERPTKFFEPSSLLPLLCIATVNLAGRPDKQHVLQNCIFFVRVQKACGGTYETLRDWLVISSYASCCVLAPGPLRQGVFWSKDAVAGHSTP